jgi:rhodanese-related sulfurtransferase
VYANDIRSPNSIANATKVNAEQVIEKANAATGLIIIDSRIHEDYVRSFIPSAVNLPDEQTNCQSLSRLIDNTERAVLFYCNGPKCLRSSKAVKIAVVCGYVNIYWFRGGMLEWKNKDYPVETP